MSRAFVKEDDGEPARHLAAERSPLRPMSVAGMRALRDRIAAETDATTRAELERSLASVRAVPAPADRRLAALGARVVVRDAGGRTARYVLGGEDEIDVARGVIGIASPLGAALAGTTPGERVTWRRPAGEVALVVESVDYDDEPA